MLLNDLRTFASVLRHRLQFLHLPFGRTQPTLLTINDMDNTPNDVLSNTIIRKVNHLCDKGDAFCEDGAYLQALEAYETALELLPEPFIQWEISTWLTVSIGDTYFLMRQFEKAEEAFKMSLFTPDGLDNPLVHLRLGQCAFERDATDEAIAAFQRAYDDEGEIIFEEDDPKYWQFFKRQLHNSTDKP